MNEKKERNEYIQIKDTYQLRSCNIKKKTKE